MRRFLLYLGGALCGCILVSALLQYRAISALRAENVGLKQEVTRLIEEHRREQRDRHFDLKQAILLEGNSTRERIKEQCP